MSEAESASDGRISEPLAEYPQGLAEQVWELPASYWTRSVKYGNGAFMSIPNLSFGCLTKPWGRAFGMFWLLNGSLVFSPSGEQVAQRSQSTSCFLGMG